MFKDVTDSQYKFVVACVLDPATETPIFTAEDIPALKAASSSRVLEVFSAVNRVNGFALEQEVKNSEASPVAV